MFKIGDKVRIEKTEGYISPLSILEFPPNFRTSFDGHCETEGMTGTIIYIDKRLIWPDRYRYIIQLDAQNDETWLPHWWLKKVKE